MTFVFHRNAKTSENKVKSLEDEITENKEALEKLEVEYKKLEEDATRVLEAFHKAQVRICNGPQSV